MKYKVLFIDWDGTLSRSRFWVRWSQDLKYSLIQQSLFRDGQALLQDWMCGKIPYATVLTYVQDKTGIPYEELENELRYSAEHMQYIDQEVIRIIQQLRNKGVQVVIATDNMDTFNLWTVPALKLNNIFDDILTSDTRGALKAQMHPDGTSMFFRQYLDRHNIRPEETVLIDDSLDTKVVEQFGMNFLHSTSTQPLGVHLNVILNSLDQIDSD